MPKCDIKIELNEDKKEYQQGDTVNGKLHVSVDKKVKCNDLIVGLKWYTHGMGERDEMVTTNKSIFKGELDPGEYSYDFSLVIDNSTPTYHGHYINIDWLVFAKVDIPWALDPKSEQDIFVKRPKEKAKTSDVIMDLSHETCFIITAISILITLFGIALCYFGIISEFEEIFLLFIGIAVTGLGIASLYFLSIQNKLAEKKIGKVEASLSKSLFHPGDTAKLNIKFTPQKTVKIKSIKAKITGEESASSQEGSDTIDHDYKISKEIYKIEGAKTLNAGYPVNYNVDIKIPNDAPPTFQSDNNEIEWSISIDIKIENCPDWCNEDEIRVL